MKNPFPIPRIVHYCWFGRGAKSAKIESCMSSWRRFLPDYAFMAWNEDTFPLDHPAHIFAKQAYDARKFAFVSDYVRLHALARHGGIYLDTDVEVLKPLDPLLKHHAFTGFEDAQYLQSGVMGAVKGHPWLTLLLAYYKDRSFRMPDGSLDTTTNTKIITRLTTERFGLTAPDGVQLLEEDLAVYPRDYFSPYDYINSSLLVTGNTYAIHHYVQSWLPRTTRVRSRFKRMAGKIIGPAGIASIRRWLNG